MEAAEELGRLSEFTITALGDVSSLDPYALLGKPVTVRLELPDGGLRYLNAHVTCFRQTGFTKHFTRYEIVAYPWLWFLTRSADCRIFQKKKIPDIIREVFSKYACAEYDLHLSGEYDEWEYCVQYRESDFQFVSRLMEQEGIYYYFAHGDGKHTLVLTDGVGHKPFPGCETLRYLPGERSELGPERIYDWSSSCEIQSGAFVIDDYDYNKPRVELLQQTREQRPHAEAAHEVYDYPGKFDTPAKGENYVRIRLEEQQGRHLTFHGKSNARGIAPGFELALTGHPAADQNRTYLVTSTCWRATFVAEEMAPVPSGPGFELEFSCVDSQVQYRSRRLTSKPVVQGPQTAVVVGPAREEIFTDAQARVKVQFHWDRYGKKDENSSCWLRVSYPMAGKQWGAVHVPRIGQEVIVDFLEGDPDRPIITGRVYNAVQTPPYAAPGTVSGIKSQTHKGKGFNALSMDDTAGQEKIDIHAQYDMATTVLHDQTNSVKNNRSTTVSVDDTLTVTGNRTMKVDGKVSETIVSGQEVSVTAGRSETINGGLTRTINDGATSTITGDLTSTLNGTWGNTVNGHVKETITSGEEQTVSAGKKLTVDGGFTETVTGARSTSVTGALSQSASETLTQHATAAAAYTSDASVTLGVAGSMVEVTSSSITISAGGSTIKVDASGVSVNGTKISLNC